MSEPDFSGIDPLRVPEARRRVEAIRRYLALEAPSSADTTRIASTIGLSRVQFGRLVRAWRDHRDAALLYRACRSNVRIIPTITNSYNGNMLHTILADEKLRKYHLQVIVEEVLDRDYDGIDIDYENVLAEDKDRYSSFIQTLADALHQEGKMLTVTVQGKTWDAAGMNGPGGQDYQLLAQNADELRVMAYGWCWRTGCVGSTPPGPIGPMHWLKNIIRYCTTKAPKDKIILGLHLYGYNWTKTESGFNGRSLVWKQADKLLQEHNLTPEWWQTDAKGRPVLEPWISFEDGAQSVTFANAQSVTARIELAKRAGIRGVILWRLGGEDPKLWTNLSTSVPPITPAIES
ncbi:MAG: hypothetical protein DSY55_06135 [Clostridia bacterium]|nr:MAG: hypothetical protein DSY55_06135 [Clostridia bacterium]